MVCEAIKFLGANFPCGIMQDLHVRYGFPDIERKAAVDDKKTKHKNHHR